MALCLGGAGTGRAEKRFRKRRKWPRGVRLPTRISRRECETAVGGGDRAASARFEASSAISPFRSRRSGRGTLHQQDPRWILDAGFFEGEGSQAGPPSTCRNFPPGS